MRGILRIIPIIFFGWASIALTAEPDPVEQLRLTTNQILSEITAQNDELANSPDRFYQLLENIVLPQFDFVRISRLVLGKNWRRATRRERINFTREFREFLVRTYATALLNYRGQEIRYFPYRQLPEATKITIKTEVSENGAPPIPINYHLYRSKDKWKIYDVVIDGVSLVSNYRSSFSAQIRRSSLSDLTVQLAERNRPQR